MSLLLSFATNDYHDTAAYVSAVIAVVFADSRLRHFSYEPLCQYIYIRAFSEACLMSYLRHTPCHCCHAR